MDLNPYNSDPPILGLTVYTPHFYSSPSISNNTPGIYIRTSSYIFGTVINSYGDRSYYASYILPIKPAGIPIDITLGIITGYKINPSGIPLLTAGKKWNLDKHTAIRATFLGQAISFSMEYSL
jgi:hypothetical protein